MAPRLSRCSVERPYLHSFICWARFHCANPKPGAPRFSTLKSIADVLNISTATVRRIISKILEQPDQTELNQRRLATRSKKRTMKQRLTFGVLERKHLDYLTSQATLVMQAGLSLYERAIAFNKQFVTVGISPQKLLRIYRQHGIKFKKVKTTKISSHKRQMAIQRRKKYVNDQLQGAQTDGRTIIYVDEVMWTRQSFRKREFSARGHNINIDLN